MKLRTIPAAVRVLTIEPLIEDLGPLDLTGIGWVIVGGESGRGARQCEVEWIRSIVRQCRTAGVPVFVRQLGSKPEFGRGECVRWANDGPTQKLRDRKGGDMQEWPEDLQVREMPRTDRVTTKQSKVGTSG